MFWENSVIDASFKNRITDCGANFWPETQRIKRGICFSHRKARHYSNMKSRAMFLSLLMGSAGCASAQSDPFQRTAPATALPSLASADTPATTASALPAEVAQSTQSGTKLTAFGAPRSSGEGQSTRVVFDLPVGMQYTLSPSSSGLTVYVQGVPVQSETRSDLGAAVPFYRAAGSQVTLSTAHPLGASGGWKASEATIASGSRVLILEFGESVSGGISGGGLRAMGGGLVAPSLAGSGNSTNSYTYTSGAPLALAAVPRSNLDRSSNPYQLPATPLVVQPRTPAARPVAAPAPVQPAPVAAANDGSLNAAPGDQLTSVRPEALPPELANAPGYTAGSDMTGNVPGAGGGALTAPRVGKSPGMTRVVVDLPAGASYRIEPQGGSLNVMINGVRGQSGGDSGISPELASWSYNATGNGTTLTLRTGGGLTAARGWRAFFLPPVAGSSERYRLAIDVAPALANLRPVAANERQLGMLTALPSGGGLSYASAVKPRVVLDPGHGGNDPGTVGAVQEKKVVLDVALRTRQFLNAAGIDVVMTRDRDMHLNANKVTDLRMRSNMGAAGQAFVSIHANAMPSQNALKGYGVETWYNPNHRLSPALASIMQKSMVDTSGAFSRGVKNSQSLGVLRNNRVPAALVEIGFLSHPVDTINLTDQNYIDRVSLGIAKGIHESLRTGVHAAPSETVGFVAGNQAD